MQQQQKVQLAHKKKKKKKKKEETPYQQKLHKNSPRPKLDHLQDPRLVGYLCSTIQER